MSITMSAIQLQPKDRLDLGTRAMQDDKLYRNRCVGRAYDMPLMTLR